MRTTTRRRVVTATFTLLALAAVPAAASPAQAASRLPLSFALPDGFPPEGIALGAEPFAYLGNRVTGAIFRADLRTGQGAVINPGPGTPSLGLKIDRRGRLFVSGGTGGDARVLDARTGALLASYPLAMPGASFINDVVLTADSAGEQAWFTDSRNPFLYRLPLGPDGALPPPDAVVRLPITGDMVFAPGTNANGIVTTPDGQALIVVQSNTGGLFRVDPATGVSRAVRLDLGPFTLVNGDGLLRLGRSLYVVQNRLNVVTVVGLDRAGASGHLQKRLVDLRFDIPTTVAAFDRQLYLPNARFSTPVTPETTYSVNALAVL